MVLGILAAIVILVAFGFLGLYLKKRQEEKEKKGFIIIASTILFCYLFPSVGLFILGLILLMILMIVGC